jgi:type II secretory pathway pseudopilin PulG
VEYQQPIFIDGSATAGHASFARSADASADSVALMAARIEQLERDLVALRRENAALRQSADSAKAESAALRQQLQSQRDYRQDNGQPHQAQPLPASANGALFKHFVIPPVPNNAPPNAPTSSPQHAHDALPQPDVFLPSMFQQQLVQQSHAQLQHLQMQQQQLAQRQQQPISRPGPALASTFDALSCVEPVPHCFCLVTYAQIHQPRWVEAASTGAAAIVGLKRGLKRRRGGAGKAGGGDECPRAKQQRARLFSRRQVCAGRHRLPALNILIVCSVARLASTFDSGIPAPSHAPV